MEKQDLLQFCKYYKGEEESPYQGTENALWGIEKTWVAFSLNAEKGFDYLSKCLNEYLSCGLRDFEQFDDTPVSLKAVLFNRFEQWDEGGDFKEFYRKYYTQKKDYRYRISQRDLNYIYESAKSRMEAHPDVAKKHQNIIQKCPYFKSEREALEAAVRLEKDNLYRCQIWAKVEKDEDIYRIQNYWLVTDDGIIKLSAEYIGMALLYDGTRLSKIINGNAKIDDVVAYD